jgi:putative FmdB family regulatory protein
MPSYEYKCIQCGAQEERIGGLDDDTALCVDCGNLMLRLNEDVFRPYFEQPMVEVTEFPEKRAANLIVK